MKLYLEPILNGRQSSVGKDRKKFLAFSHYMEALVAYHRYYGGSEK